MAVTPAHRVTTANTRLTPARDGRLVPYCFIAVVALTAALVLGRPAVAAAAVPFLLALATGLRRLTPVAVRARVELDAEQVLEDDVVTARIRLDWDADLAPELMLHRLKGVVPVEGRAPAWSVGHATRSMDVAVELQATQWGRHPVGEVWLRLRGPLGLLSWTGRVAVAPALRVLPGGERLTRLLDPAEYRAALGMHRSRRIGEGHEFADLRAYTPGDRLRDLNWAATARRGRPLVNRHHPELSGDVVIALDVFEDGSAGATEAMARAARAAWALASVHLRANDRVGLAGLGGSTRWLAPANGRRAKYQLLETLLRIGGDAADWGARAPGPERTAVPAAALVVALTPLHDERTVATLQGWQARGRSVAVVAVDTLDLLDEPASGGEALARRLWSVELQRRRRALTDLGIPVVSVSGTGWTAGAIVALRRARRHAALRRPQ